MTVFILHAPADLEAAEALEKFVERRGQFVELDDGQTALRPVHGVDVVVLLTSQNLLSAPTRLRLEQRAFDAWRQNRLLLIRMDESSGPVGFRDLDAIAADTPDAAWAQAADAITALLKTAVAAQQDDAAPPAAAPAPQQGSASWIAVQWLAAAPGLLALAAVVSIWLVNRIGPSPGGWPELAAGVDAFGASRGLPSGVTGWIFVVAIALTLLIVVRALVLSVMRLRKRAPAKPLHAPAPPGVLIVAAADRGAAKALAASAPVAETPAAAERAQQLLAVCSRAAFEDDAFKRTLYGADRIGKRPRPVYIEAAEPPEDFAYFFAGAEPLNLFDLAEAERSQALMSALGPSP